METKSNNAQTKDSILKSVKTMIGNIPEDETFDSEILLYLNGELFKLKDLGLKTKVFMIDKDTETSELEEDPDYQGGVLQYLYLGVRLLFDPPQSSFLVDALQGQQAEMSTRLNWHFNRRPRDKEVS